MYVNSLQLSNFRNYNQLAMSFGNEINIIYGNNAQGKTNILEAIFLCATGRSHRTLKDNEILKTGEQSYRISMNYCHQNTDSTIDMVYGTKEGKSIKINGIGARRFSDLIGNFYAIMFSPEEMLMIKEGPQERRRFIDITISQLRPAYFYDLQQYLKLLKQRNTLLREIRDRRSKRDTLEIWTESMIITGTRIIKRRKDFINQLAKFAKDTHYSLTKGQEEVQLNYTISSLKSNTEDAEIEGSLRKAFIAAEEKDIARGSTSCGPHRDDLDFCINGMDAKIYGSQGQQRTIVLSMILAKLKIFRQEHDEYPVLLLDDVMSELDALRQEYLLKEIQGIQTIITSTDKNFFSNEKLQNNRIFHVRQGEVREYNNCT